MIVAENIFIVIFLKFSYHTKSDVSYKHEMITLLMMIPKKKKEKKEKNLPVLKNVRLCIRTSGSIHSRNVFCDCA